MNTPMFAVEIEGVSKSFSCHSGWRAVFSESRIFSRLFRLNERLPVLDKITLRIPTGSIFTIVGVNGAGKTTLLRLLTTLLSPDEGNIKLHGISIVENPAFARGVISKGSREEAYGLFTPLENITVAAGLYGLNEEDAARAATALFREMGFSQDDIVQKRVSQLSTGGKVKVALVRAMLPLMMEHGPDAPPGVLLLDEPTANLDVNSKDGFFNALEAVRKKLPRLTVVIATNDVEEAARGDFMVSIVNGRIVEDPALVEKLRNRLEGSHEAAAELARFITPPSTDGSEAMPEAELSTVRQVPVDPYTTLSKRAELDRKRNRVVNFAILLNLAVPILLGMYVYSAEKPVFAGFIAATAGLLFSIVSREGFRIVDRERSPYNMIETVLLSPISRFAHAKAALLVGLKSEVRTATWFAGIVFVVGLLTLDMGGQVRTCMHFMSVTDAVGLAATAAVLAVSALAVGFCFVHAAFLLPNNSSFLVLQILPQLLVLCGGVYYPPNTLPPVLSWIAHVNPVTYGSQAVMEFLHFPAAFGVKPATLPAVDFVQQLLPGCSRGGVCFLLLCITGSMFAAFGTFLYSRLEPLIRKSGRYFA